MLLKKRTVSKSVNSNISGEDQNAVDLQANFIKDTITEKELEETINYAESSELITEVEPVVSAYISQLKEYHLLTEEEEKLYANMYRNGNKAEQEYAKDIMITHNLRLVISVAKHYNYEKIPLEDLIQEGNLGLIAAVERYDPSIGRFSTYAVYRIRQSIQRYNMNNCRTIRLPCHVLEQNNKINRATAELDANGNTITDDAIAEKTGMTKDMVEKYRNIIPDPISLNMIINSEEKNQTELETIIADPNVVDPADIYMDQSYLEVINALMEPLSDREKDIIRKYYGLDGYKPGTLESVGSDYDISRERVRQIRLNALRKMKNSKYSHKFKEYLDELK